jgi:ABC-type glycerol-3-phosphate transport system substrate-binding protein
MPTSQSERKNQDMRKIRSSGIAAILGISSLLLASCASGEAEAPASTSSSSAAGEQSGEVCEAITVLTNRTDIVDTVFQEYAAEFAAANDGTTVNFEAITDYEGEVSIRLNTTEYGDVLLIPNSVKPDQLGLFFEPLGSIDEMAQTYRFVQEQAFDGQVYGVAQTGNASGIVVNARVWAEAGITEPPSSPAAFLEALQTIKDKTGAIPLYTNYADGWPVTQWEGARGILAGSSAANDLTSDTSPWASGKEHYVIDSLLFDAVAAGLTEDDPTTTAWEPSKVLIGSGEVATMVLGSWAVTQMKDAAVAAGQSADDIEYWPFPMQNNGAFQSVIGGDYKVGINKNSTCKDSARAWLEYFVGDSGYAFDQGGLAPRLDGPTPTTLGKFDQVGVQYVEMTPAPAGREGILSSIEAEAEISLFGADYRQKLIDIARGAASGDKNSYFTELNDKWSRAVSAVG